MVESTATRITRVRGEMAGIRSEKALQRSLENACALAKICEDFRGQDVMVLDVTNVTSLFDFFVIATGANRRQLRAMVDTADNFLNVAVSDRHGSEGDDVPWICHDFGDIVLHVFTADGRALYDLEHLWGDATSIDWKSQVISIPTPAAPVAPSVIETEVEAEEEFEDDEETEEDYEDEEE